MASARRPARPRQGAGDTAAHTCCRRRPTDPPTEGAHRARRRRARSL